MSKHIFAAALALSLALPVAAQTPPAAGQQPQQPPKQERQVGTAGAGSATVEAIVDNPSEWFDKNVTLGGEVADVMSQYAFRLQEKGKPGMADQLLVLWPKGTQRVAANDQVRITGKVERFDRAAFQREHSISDWSAWGLGEETLSKYDNKPVLVATMVETSEAKK